jgi:hypothetical protein
MKDATTIQDAVDLDLVEKYFPIHGTQGQPMTDDETHEDSLRRELDEIRRAEMYRERNAMAQRIYERVCAILISRPGSVVTPHPDRPITPDWFAEDVKMAIAAADAFMDAVHAPAVEAMLAATPPAPPARYLPTFGGISPHPRCPHGHGPLHLDDAAPDTVAMRCRRTNCTYRLVLRAQVVEEAG